MHASPGGSRSPPGCRSIFACSKRKGSGISTKGAPFIAPSHTCFACAAGQRDRRMRSMLPRGAQRPRFALKGAIVRHWSKDNGERQIMPPIIDDAPRLTMGSFNDPLMRADHMPLGDVTPEACFQHDHQPVGVDAQAHRPVRKAGGHGIAVAIKGDQAPSRACKHALPGSGSVRRAFSLRQSHQTSWAGASGQTSRPPKRQQCCPLPGRACLHAREGGSAPCAVHCPAGDCEAICREGPPTAACNDLPAIHSVQQGLGRQERPAIGDVRCPAAHACMRERGGITHALLNLTTRHCPRTNGGQRLVPSPPPDCRTRDRRRSGWLLSAELLRNSPAGQCMARNRAFTSRCLPTPTRSTAVFASIVLGPMADQWTLS